MPRGTLFLVVGPSGAGKDTLIDATCRQRSDLYLMPRTVTRPAPDGEHIEVSTEEFSALKRSYGFALSWDANGVRYGIAREIEDRLEGGQSVILNGSRSIVAEARDRFQPLRIIHVIARLDVLSRRLRERGREDAQAIEDRLGRADREAPRGADVVTVDNSDTIEDGLAAFLEALS